MPKITVGMTTNEDDGKEPFHIGHYNVEIVAGFDENLDEIMTEAAERVRALLNRLPPEKLYSRYFYP